MSANQALPVLNYEKYRLENGLAVILLEDHRLPLAAVNVWYHVGPANERPGLTGFAHLFEHMMFEGSKYVGEKGHFRYLEAAGASEINGTTDFDRTNYFETVPSNQLELALWLESDRMGFLLDMVDAHNLENQRDVVRNERRQSVEGTPYGLVQEALFHQIFPKEHPYYASVIGSHADIESARLSDVREFFRLYYAPNNASLAIVGDIDPMKSRELVAKYFGPIPSGPPVPGIQAQTPPITTERRAVVGDQVELPRLYMGWITDPIFKPGDAECDLLARILGGGKSSRLYKRLVYEQRIAQDASAQQYSLSLGSLFTIEATAKPGVTPERLENAIDEVLDELRKDGPTAAELEGSRNTIETSIFRGLETLGGFGGLADRLNLYNHFLGDPGHLEADLERYRAATVDSLHKIAQSRLTRESRAVVHGIPGEKSIQDGPRSSKETAGVEVAAASEVSDQDWRRQPPPAGPVSPLNLPVPISFTAANGLKVYLVEQHNLPIVSANMILLCGSDRNDAGLPGLASFTAEMLDEGTEKRSALQIAVDADQIGASISTGSTSDMSFIAIRSLKKNAEGAFELMADALLKPQFPENEIERIRHDRLTQIRQQKDNPNSLASKTFFNIIYGTEHPYGYLEVGTEESNRALKRDDLVRFWHAGYVPGNAALVVAGDLTEAELQTLVARYFCKWNGISGTVHTPALKEKAGRRIVIVDKPASPQTVLRIGHIGVPRNTPDYVAIDVMNTQLGGLFCSRINLNLREKHGYTYGASSSFIFRRGPGPFVIGTSVRKDATAQAIVEILSEIERMRSTEPTPEELALAKDSIARSLPGQFETTPQAASSIGQLFVHSLPHDYYRALPAQIDSVTGAEVQRVAGQYLDTEAMSIIAVGDRGMIEQDLRKLGLCSVEVRDTDGNPRN